MTQKGIFSIVIILIVTGALALGGGIWHLQKKIVEKSTQSQPSCIGCNMCAPIWKYWEYIKIKIIPSKYKKCLKTEIHNSCLNGNIVFITNHCEENFFITKDREIDKFFLFVNMGDWNKNSQKYAKEENDLWEKKYVKRENDIKITKHSPYFYIEDSAAEIKNKNIRKWEITLVNTENPNMKVELKGENYAVEFFLKVFLIFNIFIFIFASGYLFFQRKQQKFKEIS